MRFARSAQAFSEIGRATQLASARRERTLRRVLSQFDNQIGKAIEQAARYEQKVATRPIKTLQLQYAPDDGVWTTARFEQKGRNFSYVVHYVPPSLDVVFTPDAVNVGGVRLVPLALSVSQYFTAVAFEASTDSGDRAISLRLASSSKPESNRIALVSAAGDLFRPLDSSLDGRIFPGTVHRGIVTFEPFAEALGHFEILIDSAARRASRGEVLRIRVSAPDLIADATTALEQPSILEKMAEGFRARQAQVHADVAARMKQGARGCLGTAAVWLATSGMAIAAALVWLSDAVR